MKIEIIISLLLFITLGLASASAVTEVTVHVHQVVGYSMSDDGVVTNTGNIPENINGIEIMPGQTLKTNGTIIVIGDK